MTEARNDQITIRGETLVVAWLALGIALVALAWCVRHGTLLLYGDAVAHLHIARRVFDSITPGYRQLGSVWLPLPHLLLIPFVWNMAWWQNGLAGACVSIPSYVLGCAGIYRLARMWLDRSAAIVVVAFYGLNPGLLYMATTAMTEPLFLAEMIWAVLLIVQYERALVVPEDADESTASRFLIGAGLVLVCAVFTRYDGWVYAAVAWLFATWPLLTRYRPWKQTRWRGPVGRRVGLVYRTAGCRSWVVAGLQREAIRRSPGFHPWSLLRPGHRGPDHAARFVPSSRPAQPARRCFLFS